MCIPAGHPSMSRRRAQASSVRLYAASLKERPKRMLSLTVALRIQAREGGREGGSEGR